MKNLFILFIMFQGLTIQANSHYKIKSILSTITCGESKIYLASLDRDMARETYQIFEEVPNEKTRSISRVFGKINRDLLKQDYEKALKRSIHCPYSPIMITPLTALFVVWPLLNGVYGVIPLFFITAPIDIAISPFTSIGFIANKISNEVKKAKLRGYLSKLLKMDGETTKVSKKYFKGLQDSLFFLR